MIKLNKLINEELEIAKKNLKACDKNPEDVDLLVITILKLINSGQIRGVIQFRVNGHTITNPQINEMKISLEEVLDKVRNGDKLFCIK